MFCPRCGADNADNRTLCHRCRKPLAVSAARIAAAHRIVRALRQG